MAFFPEAGYFAATNIRQPPVVWLRELAYWNEWGERCLIVNAFDEDGEDLPLDCHNCLQDAVVIVAAHPLSDGGFYNVDLRETKDDDDTIVCEYAAMEDNGGEWPCDYHCIP